MKKQLLLILSLLITSVSYTQNTIYVDSSVAISGTGLSWLTAKKTISQAITASNSGDTIKIAKGTYTEGATLAIPHNLLLFGGFPIGGGTSQDTNTNRTIIDGNNTYGIISKIGNYDLTLNHLVIQNGSAPNGGGIYNLDGGIIEIEHSIFRYNSVTSSSTSANGGAIYSYSISSTSPTLSLIKISNSSLYENSATSTSTYSYGGAVYSYALSNASIPSTSSIIVINSLIYNNTASGKSAAYGGGLYSNSYSNSTASNSKITINTSRVFNNLAYSDTSLTYSRSNGGGIYSNSNSGFPANSTINITNSSVYGNTSFCSSACSGGGIYSFANSNTSIVNITNSELFHNTAFSTSSTTAGGGLHSLSKSSVVNVVNSNIHHNSSSSLSAFHEALGGGVFSYGYSIGGTSDVSIINSNVSSNSSSNLNTAKGGGVHTASTSISSLNIANSILAYNTGGVSPNHFNNDTINNINFSYLYGEDLTSIGTGNFDGTTTNPLFVDTTTHNYHLLATSPLIDAGDNSTLPADKHDVDNDNDTTEQNPLDLDRNIRVFGTSVDLGPYEYFNTTEIIENTNLISATIYPNPATNLIYIELKNLGEYKLQMIDITGKIVLKKTIINHHNQIDISDFDKGIYLITLSNQTQQSTLRLVVQ